VKPVIGINCDYRGEGDVRPETFLNDEYCQAVEKVGGIPLLLPPIGEERDVRQVLGLLDGLILSGGKDISPHYYGQVVEEKTRPVAQKKEESDLMLVRNALDMDLPILGICYGAQLLNVSLGGSLLQDISSSNLLEHKRGVLHKVRLERDGRLYKLLGVDRLEVNSFHHQAIDRLGKGLRVCARAEDGLIEAVESTDKSFVLAVQWHPERMLDDPKERELFCAFLSEVKCHAS
jgi:putative glutamine amidotransferase